MKKILSISIIAIILLGISADVFAQPKFGHINSGLLFRQMPGREEAAREYEAFARQLEATFNDLRQELMLKEQEFQERQASFSNTERQTKQRELISLQQRVMEFQELAQEEMAEKENQIFAPIIEKARKAIEDVAIENGYSYIFDTSGGTLLYALPSDDIMDKVKAKLGI